MTPNAEGRSDPRRIADGQREGTRQRLTSSRIAQERVHELLAAYGALPEAKGRPWDGEASYRWVLERRRR